ncbi:unnamed protein product [Coregonus sp. 'balchen']|nr:unnamed protein product [Coregonus sp. 'balchen']
MPRIAGLCRLILFFLPRAVMSQAGGERRTQRRRLDVHVRSSLVHVFQAYGYTHLSAGDLLRAERGQEGSEYGQLIDSNIKDGKIVPVEITINLLRKAMEETMQLDQSKFRFLIDGFLCNQDNLQGWTHVMEGKADIQFVLFFDCSNQVCFDRCLERGKSSGCSNDNRGSLEKR